MLNSLGIWCVKTSLFARILVVLFVLCGQSSQVQAQENTRPATGSQDATHEYVFGFLPILSTQKLVERFTPLVNFLSKRLGKPVRMETAPDYAAFLQRTNQEKRYDLLFTAPHFYYMAQREAGYRVIVRVAAPEMHAIIVAPRDGPIRSVTDLRGYRISVTDNLSLGTVLTREYLKRAGIDPDRDVSLVETPTHNASLLSAYKGVTDAAALMVPPFKRAKPEIRNRMRIIATTIGVPHMPISVASTMSSHDVEIVRTSLLDLKQSTEGRALLKHLSWPGFAAAAPADYDQLEWAVTQLKQ